METTSSSERQENKSLIVALGIIIIALIVLSVVGFMFMRPRVDYYQGQVEATTVRVSGKLPGRVMDIYVKEGDKVHAGDTLVHIHSSLADAKLMQAEAMENVARQQNRKVDAGARKQIIDGAYNLWQQAKAAEDITKKTYDRIESLYAQEVVSEQKRDEAKAAYTAAQAATAAAKSQYDLAKSGAQIEDKESAASMVQAAVGSVDEVKALLEDQYLLAPIDGEITTIYPQVSELVALGAPLMDITKLDDMWITFNVREEALEHLPMGEVVEVMIPALGKQEIDAKVYYIRDMGAYAVWSATKATGQYDSKTFQIKLRPEKKVENLRPGMSIIMEK